MCPSATATACSAPSRSPSSATAAWFSNTCAPTAAAWRPSTSGASAKKGAVTSDGRAVVVGVGAGLPVVEPPGQRSPQLGRPPSPAATHGSLGLLDGLHRAGSRRKRGPDKALRQQGAGLENR